MKYELRYCEECSEYTLKKECGGKPTRSPYPPKYSPDDKYAGYRLKIKKNEWGLHNDK